MIALLLRDGAPRLWLLGLAFVAFYIGEPAFHQHGAAAADLGGELGPLGLSATLAYLAGLAMIVQLGGFISTDRREGYTRLFFAHPTSPLAFYGLRWALAYGVALATSAVFLVVGQLLAWGEFRGGWPGLLLPSLTALIYGGLIAFFSAVLARGDAWVVTLLFAPTLVYPWFLALLDATLEAGPRRLLLFALPPQTALQEVYDAVLLGGPPAWGAIGFAAGYGVFWLGLAVAVLRAREWQ